MTKIGLCGAHGTGKTTLLELISVEFQIPSIKRTMQNMWESFGVIDFEKLPLDVRTTFQKYALLNQIYQEDSFIRASFITDRTVVDSFGYTVLSTNMSGIDLKIFQELVKARCFGYTHFVYFPVEFEVANRYLRANVDSRVALDKIIKNFLEENLTGKYLTVSGSVEQRLEQFRQYFKKIE
jgi:hypothetical protein